MTEQLKSLLPNSNQKQQFFANEIIYHCAKIKQLAELTQAELDILRTIHNNAYELLICIKTKNNETI